MIGTKALAFLKKQFYIETSYKFAFILSFFGVIFSVIVYYYISKYVGGFSREAGGYVWFDYVVVGSAILIWFQTGQFALSSSLRREMMVGTLEMIFVTPTHPLQFLTSSAIWNYTFAVIKMMVVLFVGFLLGVHFGVGNLLAIPLLLGLTLLVFLSIGIIITSMILIFKKGEPVTPLVSGANMIFGGVFFPPDILPKQINWIGEFIPMYHSTQAFRAILLRNADLGDISHNILILSLMTLILFPLSYLLFLYALKWTKKMGSLYMY